MTYFFLSKVNQKFLKLCISRMTMEPLHKLSRFRLWLREMFMENIFIPVRPHLLSELLGPIEANLFALILRMMFIRLKMLYIKGFGITL